ncbi:MAG: DUF2281 domain-containing protein [Acidiferrobacterales bacterium]
MAKGLNQMRTLLDKLDQLPPERMMEVEDFVDFLQHKDRDRRLIQAATQTAEPSFRKVWDNPDDAVYDAL